MEPGQLQEKCLLSQVQREFLSVPIVLRGYMGRKNRRSNSDISRLAQKLHIPRSEVVKSQKEKSKQEVVLPDGEPLNSQVENTAT